MGQRLKNLAVLVSFYCSRNIVDVQKCLAFVPGLVQIFTRVTQKDIVDQARLAYPQRATQNHRLRVTAPRRPRVENVERPGIIDFNVLQPDVHTQIPILDFLLLRVYDVQRTLHTSVLCGACHPRLFPCFESRSERSRHWTFGRTQIGVARG
jgi:hypothetical protein